MERKIKMSDQVKSKGRLRLNLEALVDFAAQATAEGERKQAPTFT